MDASAERLQKKWAERYGGSAAHESVADPQGGGVSGREGEVLDTADGFSKLTEVLQKAPPLPDSDPHPLDFGPESILEEADRITSGDRNKYYGHPGDNHGNTAQLWSAYLQRKGLLRGQLQARDVCLMMVLLKVSRDANRPHRDNLVDICGYARNVEMIEERQASELRQAYQVQEPELIENDSPFTE